MSSTPQPGNNSSAFEAPKKVSGVRTVLKYTGIPPSWLDKRPKLPSRNWLIFWSLTGSILGYYVYDRRQCKQIKQHYIDKVKHLSEVSADPFDTPRRDYDQSLRYFRKYVKPILVAAAVDYELVPGKRHGDIAKRVAEDVRKRRRIDDGLDQDSDVTKALPTYKSPTERRKQELNGGIVIVGRPTFKEFMAGLTKGWTQGLEKVDDDEKLAHLLEDDGRFDEPEEPLPMQPKQSSPPSYTPKMPSVDYNAPPTFIPELPPLLLVPFTNYIGIKQIPLMIWGFFNQRHKVLSGAEAGYRLVMQSTRPINVPNACSTSFGDENAPVLQDGDLNFDKGAEAYYKKSLDDLEEDIEVSRKKYYEKLPEKLATARALTRGTREPTKEEYENPPPTEVELRAERLKKERRWRDDVVGWNTIKSGSPVAWDPRFQDALKVFCNPPNQNE
ncbi:inner membrane protein import complex subunit Tim54-domain-containing protein [Panaeolus papilionaceus]|nr:inner membrane protein import complex subunit Tim54-domain-containing protein [Panaeolus papilionaceus]